MKASGGGGSRGGTGGLGLHHRNPQLFWPERCVNLGGRRGYLVGWNTGGWKFVVSTVVAVDKQTGLPSLTQVERSLGALANDARYRGVNSFCSREGAPPTVLGECLPDDGEVYGCGGDESDAGDETVEEDLGSGATRGAVEAVGRQRREACWVTVTMRHQSDGTGRGRPVLRSLRVGGVQVFGGVARRACCTYAILYKPCNPDALEYIPTTLNKNASNTYKGDHNCKDTRGKRESRASTAIPAATEAGGTDTRYGRRPPVVDGASSSAEGAGGGDIWGRRTGHGTALVSPRSRERSGAIGNGGIGVGTGIGGVAGQAEGDKEGDGPTDLELAMRQVSCARVLERALSEALQEPPLSPESKAARVPSASAHGRLDGDHPTSRTKAPLAEPGEGRGSGVRCPPSRRGDFGWKQQQHRPQQLGLAALMEETEAAAAAASERKCTEISSGAQFSFIEGRREATEGNEEAGDETGEDEGLLGGLGRFCALIRGSSLLACSTLGVLEARIVWTPLGENTWQSLCDVSLACAHLSRRIEGVMALPYRLRRARRERWLPAELREAGAMVLYGWGFGMMADMLLGAVTCLLLLRFGEEVARATHDAFHLLHVDVLREELAWLNYFPAGFKLNVPLTLTLGSCTLFAIEAYGSLVGQLVPWEGAAMVLVAVLAAAGGLTTALAVSYDALRLLTLHTAGAHGAFSALLNLHSSLLGSLWRLFRGRKRNVLRRRVDTCAYDPFRLLLGTLVFTVLFFLTPTVAVFYTFFCIVHAVAVGVQALLISMFVLVNELPAYRLYLLLTNPNRLVMGFQLEVLDGVRSEVSSGGEVDGVRSPGEFRNDQASSERENEELAATTVYYFQLQRCRASTSVLVGPYAKKAKQAVGQYSPTLLAKSLLLGKPLPALRVRDVVS